MVPHDQTTSRTDRDATHTGDTPGFDVDDGIGGQVVVRGPGSAPRVLIIEDNPRVAMSIVESVRAMGGFARVAPSGEVGVPLAIQGSFDVVVVDIGLPGADGFEVIRRIRGGGAAVPLMVLTAQVGIEDIVRGLDGGADGYLAKPFRAEQFKASVRALMRRAPRDAEAVIRCGDIEMDVFHKKVRRSTRSLRLTPIEFRLLRALLLRQGEIVPRSVLMADVWSGTSSVDSSLLDVHLSRLRGKLEQEWEPKVIETVRGRGYRVQDSKGRSATRSPGPGSPRP